MTNQQAKAVVMRSRLMAIELAIGANTWVQKLEKDGWSYDGTMPFPHAKNALHVFFRKTGSEFLMGTSITIDTP